jgi:hypothetical protein
VKSRELYSNSGHSPNLQHKKWNYIMIPVIDRNYDVNDAGTDNIHVMISVIDRNCDINEIVTAYLVKSR